MFLRERINLYNFNCPLFNTSISCYINQTTHNPGIHFGALVFQGFQLMHDYNLYNFVLPSCSVFEQQLMSTNLFGYAQLSYPFLSRVGLALSDWFLFSNIIDMGFDSGYWQVFSSLFDLGFVNINLVTNNAEAKQMVSTENLIYINGLTFSQDKHLDFFMPTTWFDFVNKSAVFNTPLCFLVTDFFRTDYIDFASKNLAILSKNKELLYLT